MRERREKAKDKVKHEDEPIDDLSPISRPSAFSLHSASSPPSSLRSSLSSGWKRNCNGDCDFVVFGILVNLRAAEAE